MKRPLCTICLAVIVLVAVYTGLHPPETISYETVSGRIVQVTGQVYAKEYKQGAKAPILVLFLKPHELIYHQQNIPFQNNFICNMSDGSKEPAMGSIVCVSGILTEFEPATNPGQFDARAYYETLGISARLYQSTLVSESGNHSPIKECLWKIRRITSQYFYDVFPKEDASILTTMLLGDKSGLMTEIRDLYKDGGILHILSISGLHITILGMGLYQILRKMRIPVYPACVISGIVMILYGIMVGLPVSAVRAIGMFLVRLLAVCLKRTYDMLTALSLCAAVTLLGEPLLLYHTGFLLSYLAVFAILVMKPVMMPPIPPLMIPPNILVHLPIHKRETSISLRCPDSLITTISITIFVLPVQLSAFYEVPLYSPISNLLILPLVGFVMAVGILCLPLQLLAPPLIKLGVAVVHIILSVFSYGARLLTSLPLAMWTLGKPSLIQVIIFYGILVVVLWLTKLRYRYKMGLLCGAILILTVRFSNHLTVTFLDIGQGDCAVVELPQGEVWLIDGGSSTVSGVGTYRIEPFLKSMGIATLDAIFLSHGDIDHINGVEEMLINGDIKIKMLVLPYTDQTGSKALSLTDNFERNQFYNILQEAEKKNIPIMWLAAGAEWRSGDVSVQSLHPSKDFISEDSNSSSQVLYLKYDKFSVLFTGDVEGEGELQVLEVLKKRNIANTTVLKVAHHGSKNATSRELISLLKPKYAIISCSKRNSYGHPHEAVISRLQEADANIIYTMESGAVTFTTDGEKLKTECFLKESK